MVKRKYWTCLIGLQRLISSLFPFLISLKLRQVAIVVTLPASTGRNFSTCNSLIEPPTRENFHS